MNNIQDTYRRPIPREWKERIRSYGTTMYAPLGKEELILPNWLIGKSIVFFFIVLFASWTAFGYIPGLDLILIAGISVVLFFYGGKSIAHRWVRSSERKFIKYVFVVGLIVRLAWILYMYFIFNPNHFDNTYGSQADTDWYMDFGRDIAMWISGDSKWSLSETIDANNAAIDDVGYPFWLGVLYFLTGNVSDVFIPFCVKSIVSAYCAICMYHVDRRHFGVGVARMAAIFVCVNPNMIYWCASMMKETEMVFVLCLAVDNLDKALTSGERLSMKSLWPGALAGLYLFFFRTALGLALFLAVFAHIVMASHRVMSLGKKILAGVLILVLVVYSVGDRVMMESSVMLQSVQSGDQETNMEWRSKREGGNEFAKYAGAAVFAPLIFTIPFPTFNQANEDQLVQVQLAGGSYIKNVLSYFVVLVLILLLVSGDWRRHVFILAYTVGYLMVLVFSGFAQSGRFHMPAIPLLMLLAAYGVQIAKRNARVRNGYTIALIVEFAACLAWNWFKLKGRGMI